MPQTLVATAELVDHPEWRVFDCRHDLMKPAWGQEEFAKSHIPGAHFARLDHDLSAPKTVTNRGRHPLPEPDVFAMWLGSQGLKAGDQVVCYDQGPGSIAARLWWMLRWIGHDAVAVLDGGFAKWVKEGRPVTAEAPSFPVSSFSGRVRAAMFVEVEAVEKNREKSFLLDARAPVRFRGEQEPIDPVAGHIPGALNRFNNDNVTADGTFKPPESLRAEFNAVMAGRKPGEVVHYCGSGVSACHNLLAMEVAGLPGGRLYPGSWSEWIADPKRPIAR